jgi:hypothetical protein
MDLMMEKLVVTRIDMTRDTTSANKISMTKYKKLMEMAIKLVTKKDFKKDMTIVKKNLMAQILCFTIPQLKFLVPTQALKRRNPPFSRL